MAATQCPVCVTDGAEYTREGNDRFSVHCPVCRRYTITGTAAASVKNWDQPTRLLLAGRIRRHWADTKRPMLVTSDTLDGVNGPSLTSVLDKQDALLFDIADQSLHPGAVVKLGPFDCVVVDGMPGDELTYHVQSLIDRKLLQHRGTVFEAIITSQGWEHLERLRNPLAGNRSDIFVAMSFSESLRSAWEKGIRPGVTGAGYHAKRIDSDAHNDKIDDRIIAGIRACYAIIVDVTTQNAGAYFEAGFAMGLGRPVVWTVHKDDLQKLHFDTRQFNHIVWSDEAELSEKLTNHLLAVFGRGPVLAS